MNRRSLAFGTSRAEKIPPINKNKTPKTQMINVVGQNRATHNSPIRHIWKRPYKIIKENIKIRKTYSFDSFSRN
jgi:hypothetical protein